MSQFYPNTIFLKINFNIVPSLSNSSMWSTHQSIPHSYVTTNTPIPLLFFFLFLQSIYRKYFITLLSVHHISSTSHYFITSITPSNHFILFSFFPTWICSYIHNAQHLYEQDSALLIHHLYFKSHTAVKLLYAAYF